jgi:Bacteriophage HK97-gp10, putative tail-component
MSLSARAQFTPRGDLGRFVPVFVTPGVTASVEAWCKLVLDRILEIVPRATGALADSYKSEVEDTGRTVVGRVGSDLYYAPYVEFGTGIRGAASAGAGEGPYSSTWPGMVAQPHIRPSFDEARGATMDLFRSNISLSL